MKQKSRKSSRIISGLILSSILGFSVQAVPVQAAADTISGDQVQTETTVSGIKTTTINTDNPAIGNTDTNTASGNTLTISGGTITSADPGSNVYGGVVASNINADASEVKDNTLTITGTTIGSGSGSATIFGGFLSDYKAQGDLRSVIGDDNRYHYLAQDFGVFTISGNTVTITDSTAADNTAVTVYGGAHGVDFEIDVATKSGEGSLDAGRSTVTGNTVYIGTSADQEAAKTYAAAGNKCTYDNIYGGYAAAGSVTYNTVTARNLGLTKGIYGGFNQAGEVLHNTVTISNVSGAAGTSKAVGGYADCVHLEKESGDADYNTVNVTDSTLYEVAGGVTRADPFNPGGDFQSWPHGYDAIGNDVNIEETAPGKTVIQGVIGGYAWGDVRQNTVDITSGTVANVWGGYSDGINTDHFSFAPGYYDYSWTAQATDNIVTIGTKGSTSGPTIGSVVIGGEAYTDDVSGNQVYIYSSTVGVDTSLKDFSNITDYSYTNIIAGGVAEYHDSFLTIPAHPKASDEDVHLAGGIASNNDVYVEDSTIGNQISSIFGGIGMGEASGNTVQLQDTSVALGSEDVDHNKYIYNNDDGANALDGSIVGGQATNGSASGNKVTITSTETATVTGLSYLVGGKAALTTYHEPEGQTAQANNNIVSVSNVTLEGTTAEAYGETVSNLTLVGGIGQDGASGNTLELTNTKATNVKEIDGSITDAGSASDTTLSITRSNIQGTELNVYGAKTEDGEVKNGFYTIDTSNIKGISSIYGGYSTGENTGNSFSISNSTLYFNGSGTGMMGEGGTNVHDNTFSISDSTLSDLQVMYINYSGDTAKDNTSTLTYATITNIAHLINAYTDGVAENNTLNITDSSLSYQTSIDGEPVSEEYSLLAGGFASDSAIGNTLSLTNTTVKDAQDIFGGVSYSQADGNKVISNGSTLTNTKKLAGGYSEGYALTDEEGNTTGAGSADDNIVEISGGTATIDAVYGGRLGTFNEDDDDLSGREGTANNNQVTLGQGVTAEAVFGGRNNIKGDTSGNTVTTYGNVASALVGGETASGDASDNTVNVYGGYDGYGGLVDPQGNLIDGLNVMAGGYAFDGAADRNTVNIYAGNVNAIMSLYGGYSKTESKDNTLNMYNKGNTVRNLGYFQNLNFYVPEGTTAGETMIEVTNNADVSGAAITAGVYNNTQIRPGQVINLIHDSANGVTTDENTTYSMMSGRDYVVTPGLVRYDVLIKKQDPETIVLYIPEDSKGTVIPATKLMTSQRNRAISTVTDVTDTASTSGFDTAVATWNAENGISNAAINAPIGGNHGDAGWEDHEVWKKYTPYVLLGGNDLRYDAGSTTNTQGFNSELGFVKRSYHDDYIDTYMPFLEYGNGNYTERYQGSRGDGNQQYIGAGILVRRDRTDGLHYEAVLRAGQLNTDYHADIAGHHISYDTDTNYIAAQLGLGKLYTHKDNDYDIYTKLFWSHLFSDNVDIYSDLGKAQYQFDSTDSVRSRIGFRWTKHYQENQTYYVGLGWDHEFDGTARATYNNFNLPEKDGKGDAGFLELGWSSQSHKDNPWNADVKLRGWVGMKKGIDYTLTIGRAF